MTIAAVVVAAGRGERAGAHADGPKQYRRIGPCPVIVHTLNALIRYSAIGPIVVVHHAEDHARMQDVVRGIEHQIRLTIGGATRQESVLKGLEALAAVEDIDKVLIHDAVRPFAGTDLLDRVLQALMNADGALPALPVTDTLKQRAEGHVAGTVKREGLFAAQTPQGFRFGAILHAHREAARSGRTDFTDDSSIAEWAGLKVALVEGDSINVKLTTAADIAEADRRLRRAMMIDVRTGNGYDVHRLVPGQSVTLCGVAIPHDQRLDGHSDADVGLHALTDALLATCGAGDIGDHFPPTDERWRGAASHIFVERAMEIITEHGGWLMNADISLICEAPKIAPHRSAMRETIAAMTGLSPDRVSVKATTNEALGFLGRREGIAAIATVSVNYGAGH